MLVHLSEYTTHANRVDRPSRNEVASSCVISQPEE